MKRFFLLLLLVTYCIIFSDPVVPLGNGTQDEPYLISSIENLLWVSTYEEFWLPELYYIQTNDINAGETSMWNDRSGFPPIAGGDHCFKSNYDGQGHTIDSLYISRHPNDNVGLFAKVDSATICNLDLTNLYVRGYDKTGGLAGYCRNSEIYNIYIEGHVLGHNYVGMLLGSCYSSFLENCTTSGILDGWHQMGGISGRLQCPAFSCTTNVDISGIDSAGGLAGLAGGAVFYNCVANSQITVNHRAGGIACYFHDTEVYDCYAEFDIDADANYSGITADDLGSEVINSYYNYETSTFNNEHIITRYALSDELFTEWLSNDMELEINELLNMNSEGVYEISNISELTCLLPFGDDEHDFILTADLDLTELPNFYIPYFTGNFDGNGHIISNMNVNNPQINQKGFLGCLENSTVMNLHLDNVFVSGNEQVGGLAGKSIASDIEGCSADGMIEGSLYTGGIIGMSEDGTVISNCSFNGEIFGNMFAGGLAGGIISSSLEKSYVTGEIHGQEDTGGLTGYGNDAIISECFADADVYGNNKSGGLAGTLVSFYEGNVVENCYAMGSVHGTSNTGGVAGRTSSAEISYCYARILMNPSENTGGLVGLAVVSEIRLSVWDNEYSGINEYWGEDSYNSTAVYVIAADSLMMQDITLYTDISWDFVGEAVNGTEDIWDINEDINNGYPFIYDIELPVSSDEEVIQNSKLKIQNYPNPFNPITNIRYELAKNAENVTLKVYNIKGQKVSSQALDKTQRGQHIIPWNAKGMSSGVYFYQIKADAEIRTGKMLLLK